ncbi:MAG: glutamate racemase [Chloroflexi bacterium]|nr:glutamate racemase [Chloroflexota bacterium]
MSDARPVGIFDSGIGGLNVLHEIRRQQPTEHCVYVADSREAPYGTKSIPYIQGRCGRIVDFLLERGAKAIVVACNAASVAALSHLRRRYAIPFVGIVPAVKPAARMTRSGKIGVLTTPATADSEPLADLVEQFAYNVTVMTQICPGLVPLVERAIVDGAETEQLLRRYLAPLLEGGVDTIVLGCTHYPFLRSSIERICGPGVAIIDPSDAVARQLGRVLAMHGLESMSEDRTGSTRYFTTGDPEEFRAVVEKLIGPVPDPVEHARL